jgi:hypothetical protein
MGGCTYITKVPIQNFNKEVDLFKYDQLIVAFVDTGHEIEGCVSLINHLCADRGVELKEDKHSASLAR